MGCGSSQQVELEETSVVSGGSSGEPNHTTSSSNAPVLLVPATPSGVFMEEVPRIPRPILTRTNSPERIDPEKVQSAYINATMKNRDSRFKIATCPRFPGVIACGAFSWSKGNFVDGIILDGDYHEDHWSCSQLVLPTNPEFKSLDKRPELCLLWVRRILLGFHLVIDESNSEIKRSMPGFGKDYHHPTSVLVERTTSGPVVVVTLWVRWKEDGDTDPDDTYRRVQYEFAGDGSCTQPKFLKTKVVSIKDRALIN